MMEHEHWVEQLYNDESLTNNLHDGNSEKLLSWAESALTECEDETEAHRLLDSLRLLNHYVGDGGKFSELFIALKTNAMRGRKNSHFPIQPVEHDPLLDELYPADE